jgi:hypothetical protein
MTYIRVQQFYNLCKAIFSLFRPILQIKFPVIPSLNKSLVNMNAESLNWLIFNCNSSLIQFCKGTWMKYISVQYWTSSVQGIFCVLRQKMAIYPGEFLSI